MLNDLREPAVKKDVIVLMACSWLVALLVFRVEQSGFWQLQVIRDSKLLPFQPQAVLIGLLGNLLVTVYLMGCRYGYVRARATYTLVGMSFGFWLFGILCIVLSIWSTLFVMVR